MKKNSVTLSPSKGDNRKLKDPYRFFLDYCLWLLGRKQYSEAELRSRIRLRMKKVTPPSGVTFFENIIEQVLTRLKELDLISDDRILRDYFAYRLPTQPEGKYAFMARMIKRGIPKESANKAWTNHAPDEHKLAQEVFQRAQKKIKKLPIEKQKQRLAGLLARKGFPGEMIWDLLKSNNL